MTACSTSFDNVMLRLRGKTCIVTTTVPPFVTLYWPDIEAPLKEFGATQSSFTTLSERRTQAWFASELAQRIPQAEAFRPRHAGFGTDPDEIRLREKVRETRCSVIFTESCSLEVALSALELVSSRLRRGATLHIEFRDWDLLADWSNGRVLIDNVLSYLLFSKNLNCSVTLFSELIEIPVDLWDYIYDRPRVRLGWKAAVLEACCSLPQFEDFLQQPIAKNLDNLAKTGIWPRIVLPATQANVRLLPELVAGLIDLTRGGTLEIVPVIGTRPGAPSLAPPLEEYVKATLAIYTDRRTPIRAIEPHSWVASRIDAEVPLVTSFEAAGAEIVIRGNGDIYPGRSVDGLSWWRMGNVLQNSEALQWERLDAMAEVFPKCSKPTECQTCDWRHRCGGADSSVMFQKHHAGSPAPDGWQSLFRLYCEPRKALFEEALWDSVSISAHESADRPREILELSQRGINFLNAPL